LTVVVPLLFHCFTPQNRAEKGYSIRFCFVACKAIFPDDCNPRTKQSAWIVFGSERRRAWVRFLVKHTRRNNWANQHNPNNKAYKANADNNANQKNPNRRTHQQAHNANRRNKQYWTPEWAPDYPEYDD